MPAGISIPNRFESLQAAFGKDIRPLIVPVDDDLAALNRLREQARVQNGGLMCFLLGPTGIGKTTAVYSSAVNMPSLYAPVVSVPGNVDFRDTVEWLMVNASPDPGGRTTLVLFDGREVSDDTVGVLQLLSSLNQFLRRRADVLFCWPTTDEEWHIAIRDLANKIGGSNFCPEESDYEVRGPGTGEWPLLLDRLLLQFGKTYDDIGIAKDLIGRLCAETATVGEFLTKIGSIVAERIAKTIEAKRLPQILFVVTSSGDAIGEANRIRRAGTQILAPEPLLGYSPRSEAGKWWTARNVDPNQHLGYMISLFQASLVTMSASAVVYSILHHGEEDLSEVAVRAGARPDKGNATRTIQASEFYRYLKREQIPEFTSGRKGSVQDSTVEAYSAIQALSSKRHKAINQALCEMTREHLPELAFSDSAFEVPYQGDVITDATLACGGRTYHVEFHHLSEAQCKAASMSSYIMDKIRNYAHCHQLVPR